jgi:hypothetical protein
MSNRAWVVVLACAFVLATGSAWAQSAGEAPKPSPEHKKLGYFVGTWTSKGEMADNPFMPGGPFSSTDKCEWFEGGFSVVCHTEGKGPMGPTKGLGIMTYSPEEKVYAYYGVDNTPMAMMSIPRGTIDGDTWTYLDESEMGGATVKSRYVLKVLSPTSYSFKWEMQAKDGSWQTIMNGTSTKAG